MKKGERQKLNFGNSILCTNVVDETQLSINCYLTQTVTLVLLAHHFFQYCFYLFSFDDFVYRSISRVLFFYCGLLLQTSLKRKRIKQIISLAREHVPANPVCSIAQGLNRQWEIQGGNVKVYLREKYPVLPISNENFLLLAINDGMEVFLICFT